MHARSDLHCLASHLRMATVAEFINSIENLDDSHKGALKAHVQTREFGSNLDDDCDEAFKATLQVTCQTLSAVFSAQEASPQASGQ